MQLCDQYRPQTWSDVVGQDKAIAKIDALRKRGLGGRAYWISGQSGTGKSSIGRLIQVEAPALTASSDAPSAASEAPSTTMGTFARPVSARDLIDRTGSTSVSTSTTSYSTSVEVT